MTLSEFNSRALSGFGTSALAALEPFVFFRERHFYVVQIPRDQILVNVELNPGTIKVEDIDGNIVWRQQ